MNRLAVVAAVATMTAVSFGQIYEWTFDRAVNGSSGINDAAGKLLNATGSFNTITNQFSWYGTYQAKDGVLPNGFWLAVSPGPNPKGHPAELAIIYLDGSNSTPNAYVYGYNGKNDASSFYDGSNASGTQAPDKILSSKNTPGAFLDIKVQDNGNGTRTLGLTMDASAVQSHVPLYGTTQQKQDYTGVAFGPKVGLWWHPVSGLKTSTSNGWLTKFDRKKEGYFDANDKPTNPVPEPATIIALSVGAAALLRRRGR
ncbi:MAG: PEP-CTERM sorting domain-containing protein [Fimbriimonadaceae bacterium]|nr:PEP-CTERM sorting domain-containing protein [Fimbriimonadaceae bacterium]